MKIQTIESPNRLLVVTVPSMASDLVIASVIRKQNREGSFLELLRRSTDRTVKLPAGDWEIFGKLPEFRANHNDVWEKAKGDLQLVPENTLVLVDSKDTTFYPQKLA